MPKLGNHICSCFLCLVLIDLMFSSADATAGFTAYNAIAVSREGKLVAAGGAQGRIYIWEVASGKRLYELHTDHACTSLAFADLDRTLAAGTMEGGVEIFGREANGFIRKAHVADEMMVYAVAVSSDGKILAVSCHSGWSYFFATHDWQPAGVLFEPGNLTSGFAFAHDGSFIATAGNTFRLWEARPDAPIWKSRGERSLDDIKSASARALRWTHNSGGAINVDVYCDDIAISPDDRRVAGVTGVSRLDSGGTLLYVWDARTGMEVWKRNSTGMSCVAFISDAKQIITGSDDGTVRLWNVDAGQLLHESKKHARAVRGLAPLPHGTQFFSASVDGTVLLWDASSAAPARSFPAEQ